MDLNIFINFLFEQEMFGQTTEDDLRPSPVPGVSKQYMLWPYPWNQCLRYIAGPERHERGS